MLALALARAPVDLPQPGGLALWLGRLTGLLAEVLVLGQLLLSARVPVLERAAGQDQLLRWHRTMAPLALVCVLLHPLLLAASYTASGGGGLWSELWTTGTSYLDASRRCRTVPHHGRGLGARVRARMPYESWYVLHLTAYAAVGLAFGHQLSAGSEVLHGTVVRTWWIAQLVVVVGAIVMFRVLLPVATSLRHRVRVEGVDRHAGNVVSVRLSGQDLHRSVRRAASSSSAVPDPRELMVAGPPVQPVDGTAGGQASVHRLGRSVAAAVPCPGCAPGTRVVVEGPYGVMTDGARTPKAVLIGAGLRIAPMQRCSPPRRWPSSCTARRTGLRQSCEEAGTWPGPVGAPRCTSSPAPGVTPCSIGRPVAALHRLVPDLRSRDVYVCGRTGLAGPLLAELRGHRCASPADPNEKLEL